jgi:hypothetical protein
VQNDEPVLAGEFADDLQGDVEAGGDPDDQDAAVALVRLA